MAPDFSAGKTPDYWSNNNTKSALSNASEAGWDSDEEEDGGIDLNHPFNQMSVSNTSSTTGSLIPISDETDSRLSISSRGGPVRSGSNGYSAWGNGVASKAGSVSSSSAYRSSVSNYANRSETQYKSSGFAKIKAYVSSISFHV